MGQALQSCLRRIGEYLWLASPRLDEHKKRDDAALPPDSFEAAAAAARSLPSLSTAVKLRLYGLYKQATVGDAPGVAPSASVLDPAAAVKWRSWASLRGMAAGAARDQYVHAVATAARGGVEEGEEDETSLDEIDAAMGSMAGPVMSAMHTSAEEEEALAQADKLLPLHAAARAGDAARCAALVGGTADVDALDEDAHTPLHWACDGGHLDAVRVLLDRGAAVGALNCDGSTPLHMAMACEHVDVARELLGRGADAGVCDADGCTPDDLASEAVRAAVKTAA
jgi:acyl-CoA-binding protein